MTGFMWYLLVPMCVVLVTSAQRLAQVVLVLQKKLATMDYRHTKRDASYFYNDNSAPSRKKSCSCPLVYHSAHLRSAAAMIFSNCILISCGVNCVFRPLAFVWSTSTLKYRPFLKSDTFCSVTLFLPLENHFPCVVEPPKRTILSLYI